MREIPGQPSYLCSKDGRVYSTKRGSPVEMSAFPRDRTGHLGVNLTHGGKYRMHSVHRLVAIAWIGPPPSPQHVVMHLDDDPANNRASNLAYGLPAENSAQMVARRRQACGGRHGAAKLTEAQVAEIKQRGDFSITAVAREFSVTKSTIYDIKQGKTWRHV